MTETMQSAIHTRPEDVVLALATRTYKTFYDHLIPAGRLHDLWVQEGDRTTGRYHAFALDYAKDYPMEVEDVFDFVWTYSNEIVNVAQICFDLLARLGAEEEMAAPRPSLREEINVLGGWLADIAAVEELKVRETNTGFETWVVVNNASEETRYAIYDVEWELMRQFPDCTFDFHLVDREGMDLSSIVSFGEGTLTIAIRRRDYAR